MPSTPELTFLNGLDYAVLGLYMLTVVGIGVYVSRFNRKTDDYFKGGGHVPWGLAGRLAVHLGLLRIHVRRRGRGGVWQWRRRARAVRARGAGLSVRLLDLRKALATQPHRHSDAVLGPALLAGDDVRLHAAGCDPERARARDHDLHALHPDLDRVRVQRTDVRPRDRNGERIPAEPGRDGSCADGLHDGGWAVGRHGDRRPPVPHPVPADAGDAAGGLPLSR